MYIYIYIINTVSNDAPNESKIGGMSNETKRLRLLQVDPLKSTALGSASSFKSNFTTWLFGV